MLNNLLSICPDCELACLWSRSFINYKANIGQRRTMTAEQIRSCIRQDWSFPKSLVTSLLSYQTYMRGCYTVVNIILSYLLLRQFYHRLI